MTMYQHGTSTAYSYHKCRCDECKAWKKATSREYYERHRDVVKARNRAYYHANSERISEVKRAYKHSDPERWADYNRRWAQENAEQVNTKNRRWRRANPWKAWFYNWRQRELRRGQVWEAEVLDWIKNLVDPECTYCGSAAETIDHIVPRSKGGTNDRANLTPACHRCNRRKQHMSVEDFLRRLREE